MAKQQLVMPMLLMVSVFGLVHAAYSSPALSLRIEAEPLDKAIGSWAQQTGYQVLVSTERLPNDSLSPEIKGVYTPEGALKVLLARTDLKYEFVNSKTVAIRAEGTGDGAASNAASKKLEEVVVTAQRREQRSQDVPTALQVFAGSNLDRQGANGFEDYILQVPAVSFRDQGNGAERITLRGISNASASDFGTGTTASTVGLYLNEVPIQGTSVLTDLSLYDLERVEVLKGPQGTLYGEGAVGGAIRMILAPPKKDGVEFKGDSMLSSTANNDGSVNYRVRGAVNLPLSSAVAARIVATYRNDAGFVDNTNTLVGKEDYNDFKDFSVRAMLSADFSDRFSGEFLALHEDSDTNGFPRVDLALSGLQVNRFESEKNKQKTDVFAATLKYDLGFASFSSVSSFYEADRNLDIRAPFIEFFAPVVVGVPAQGVIDLRSFAQELRLVSGTSEQFEWIVGGFYRDKTSDAVYDYVLSPTQFAAANTPTVIFPDPNPYHETIEETFKQKAVYGEGTLKLTPSLDLIAGFRWFDERVSFEQRIVATGAISFINLFKPTHEITDKGVVPKVSIAFHPNREHLVYLSASQGFRAPAVNQYFLEGAGTAGADADSLWNYEFGSKNSFADNRLMINASIYYIDWKDMQGITTEFVPALGGNRAFISNVGDARVKGGELEIAAQLLQGLTASASYGRLDSELTSKIPGSSAIVGAPLANSPRWTVSANLDYRRGISERVLGFVHLDAQATSSQYSATIATGTPDGLPLEKYSLYNVKFGIETDAWSLALFGDNVTNKVAQLGRSINFAAGAGDTNIYSVVRPRTIGVMASFKR